MNDVMMLKQLFPLFSSSACLFLQASKYAKPLPPPPPRHSVRVLWIKAVTFRLRSFGVFSGKVLNRFPPPSYLGSLPGSVLPLAPTLHIHMNISHILYMPPLRPVYFNNKCLVLSLMGHKVEIIFFSIQTYEC